MKSEGKIEQPQQIASETSSLEALELKVNLNTEQKDYLEKLKAKKDKILQGKTTEQLAKAGDLETLKKYNAVLDEILKFLRTKEMKEIKKYAKIECENPDGEKIEFDLAKELKDAKWFFADRGIDWIDSPREIFLTETQVREFQRCVKEYNFNKVMIIPAEVADNGIKLRNLSSAMTEHLAFITYDKYYPEAFVATEERKNLELRNGLRIVLYSDKLAKNSANERTREKSANELLAPGGLLKKEQLDGMSQAEFLILQYKYFRDHKRLMDYGDELMLLGSKKFNFDIDRVISVHWNSNKLVFDGLKAIWSGSGIICPSVKVFEIEA